ncbi:hypothetical protein [Azohydromonas australica]|uniref:hypothetical protein n=1 Tax=Azohydromonas australica TaxID=364039 RepID=UPI00040583CB|nr:hypothetical protein [Azohydromonas australica]
MIDRDWHFVLGAQDPEMREIQRVVEDEQLAWAHAARHKRRCNPRTAYAADGVVRVGPDQIPRAAVLPPKAPAVFVECTVLGLEPVVRVDHHHPGDPGYEVEPEKFMDGSSLGQVLRLLEREPTETQRLLAASDHCLTAAYQGRCPGVDPHELLFLRASWKAKVMGRTLSDVVEGILDAAKRVRAHHDSELGESRFLDPTEIPPDLAEGAAYAGIPVRYRELLPEGVLKEMFKGGTPAAVEQFMAEHEAAGRQVYGNPYRGYAGTYWSGRRMPEVAGRMVE